MKNNWASKCFILGANASHPFSGVLPLRLVSLFIYFIKLSVTFSSENWWFVYLCLSVPSPWQTCKPDIPPWNACIFSQSKKLNKTKQKHTLCVNATMFHIQSCHDIIFQISSNEGTYPTWKPVATVSLWSEFFTGTLCGLLAQGWANPVGESWDFAESSIPSLISVVVARVFMFTTRQLNICCDESSLLCETDSLSQRLNVKVWVTGFRKQNRDLDMSCITGYKHTFTCFILKLKWK